MDGKATIKFYFNEIKEENLITLHTKVTVSAIDNYTVSADWTPENDGNYTIIVVIENCEPIESNTENTQATINVDVEKKKDGGGFSPGFEIYLTLISIIGVGRLIRTSHRKN